MPHFTIYTHRFGALTIEATNLRDARKRARRYGAGTAYRDWSYVRCEWCDSQPCVCTRQDAIARLKERS